MDVHKFWRIFLGLGDDARNVFDRNFNHRCSRAAQPVAHQTNQKIRYSINSNLKC